MEQKTNIISKQVLKQVFGGKDAADTFVGKTGIVDAVTVTAVDIENIRAKHNLYVLQNISMTTNTTGKVKCDSSFANLMQKRRTNTFFSRLRGMAEHSTIFLWLLGTILLYFLAVFYFKPAIAKDDAEDAQLLHAQKIVQTGAWKKDKTLRFPKGPLKIDILAWNKSQYAEKYNDSLQALYDVADTNKDSLISVYQTEAEKKTAPIKKHASVVVDSIAIEAKKQASIVLDSAQEVFRKVTNTNIRINSKLSDAKKNLEKAQKRAGKILEKAHDDGLVVEQKSLKEIAAIENIYQKKIDSVSNSAEVYRQKLNKAFIQETDYPYDLNHPTLGSFSRFMYRLLMVVCCILFFVFCYYFIQLIREFPRNNNNERQKYSFKNLRIMAFPGFVSQNAVRNNTSTCNVIFHDLQPHTIEKLVSVGLRYSLNALVNSESFDFDEPLLAHEKLTDLQKRSAPKPLFYVIDGEQATFFSGLAGELTPEEIEKTNNPIVM